VNRVLRTRVSVLRAEYAFLLARLCHCPPPMVDQTRIFDFARLIHGIDMERGDR
jgi:hypothetical protein